MIPFSPHLRSLKNRSEREHRRQTFSQVLHCSRPLGENGPALPRPSTNPPARRKGAPASDRSAVPRTPVGNGGGVKHGLSGPPARPPPPSADACGGTPTCRWNFAPWAVSTRPSQQGRGPCLCRVCPQTAPTARSRRPGPPRGRLGNVDRPFGGGRAGTWQEERGHGGPAKFSRGNE